MRPVWMVAAGLVAVAFLAPAAVARCVRDVAPSGAISVRCADGVRGYLPSDDAVAPSANSSYRSPDSRNARSSDNYTAPATGSSSSYTYRSPDSASRPADPAASALNRGRGNGTNDRPAY